MGSVQLKFALTYVALIMGLLLLLNTYPLIVSRELIFDAKEAALTDQAVEISRALSIGDRLEEELVDQVIYQFDIGGLDRLVVTDGEGIILYDTEGRASLGQPAELEDLTTALGGFNVFRYEYAEGSFHTWIARPIRSGEDIIGGVFLYENDLEQGVMMVDIQRNLQNISIGIFIVSLCLALVFSQTLTSRLRVILSAIRVVGKGDYSYKVPVRGSDELAELGQSFNLLTDRLQETEEVRRRFVSDASHELKTPLASIQLLSDSIVQSKDMDLGTIREFVVDIGQEAERLARTTERLLRLTRLDVAPETQIFPVDVGRIVVSAGHMLRPLAQGRWVRIIFELETDCRILAAEDDIYQIVVNLAENGIKYNVEGGMLILRLEKVDRQIRLTVEDTGIGIPEEDLPHIFDRFYRVDKARSREQGGSGLGLSIVKDTVRQHGGEVKVTPREGGGTKFIVTFPAWEEEEI